MEGPRNFPNEAESGAKEDSPMMAAGGVLTKVDPDLPGIQRFWTAKTCQRVFLLQWIFTLASSILAYFYIGNLVQAMVNKSLVISPTSEKYYLWEDPPVSPEFRIYLFNITNADNWLRGIDSKIRVSQVGPFVYKEFWKKTNVIFHDSNSSVSYKTLKKFFFVPGKSANLNDKIVLPNVPMVSAASSMKNANDFTLFGFRLALNSLAEESKSIFVTKTAEEFIWGYDDKLSEMASYMLPPEDVGVPGKFGFFAGKNLSEGDWMTVNTGEKSLKLLSETLKFRGKENFNAWSSEKCNQVGGSDGSYYPPGIHKTDKISLFVPEFCSSLTFTSDGEEFYYGQSKVKGLRFKPQPSTFNYDFEENYCFCENKGSSDSNDKSKDEESDDGMFSFFGWFSSEPVAEEVVKSKPNCPNNGVFELGGCKNGAPIVVSWPMFNKADPKFRNDIEGLEIPDDKLHGFYLDIQPTMGISLMGKIRMQLNLKLERSKILTDIPLNEGQQIVVPLMWFEELIDPPPESILDMLSVALTTGSIVANKALIFSVVFLVGQIIVFGSYTLWKSKSAKKPHLSPYDSDWKVVFCSMFHPNAC